MSSSISRYDIIAHSSPRKQPQWDNESRVGFGIPKENEINNPPYGPATTNTGFCGSGVPLDENEALRGAGICNTSVSFKV